MLALATLTLPVSVSAATVYLVAPSTDLFLGQTYQVELWTADFGPFVGSVGGGVDAFYDAAVLDYVSWTDTSGSTIPTPGLPQDLIGEVNAIQVDTGAIDWLPIPAMQSGILEFTVLPTAALGATSITLAENDTPLGGFFAMAPIAFNGASFNILNGATVPLPGGLLLLGSALGLMGFARSRNRQL